MTLRHSLAFAASFTLLTTLPACDCAGNMPVDPIDAGDVGLVPDGGARDVGPTSDIGPQDAGPPRVDAPGLDSGPCIATGAESCNTLDDDCDGSVDESTLRPCGTDVGECVVGYETCTDGTYGACDGEVPPEATDACNGVDDDCDEAIDEGCACTDGDTQSCGSDVGECTAGTQTCASGAWGTCVGEVTAVAESCNGRDDNCDGVTDEACDCVDGDTQPCGTDVGECTAGTQTCASGAWGTCVGETTARAELCNTLDDDCDAASDETFVLGMACDGADADRCAEGVTACDPSGASTICSDTSGDTPELCNTTDDDCDLATDEGFMLGTRCDGPDADTCAEGAFMCDVAGTSSCSDTSGDSIETCNGMDDDCDGATDEGNPGGGVACMGATDVGACISRTACVDGSLICRGTFVSSAGLPTNPGTPSAPLPSIASAIANAVVLGGGTDVCVCDTAAAGASTFTEDVTMVEGTDVNGGFDCTSWTVVAGRTTAIQDVDDDGVSFAAGLTSGTTLRRMTVDGFDRAGGSAVTSAITITDASPGLDTVVVLAGDAATAIGLRVVESSGRTAAPAITNSTIRANGVASGTAVSVSIEAAAPRFTSTTIGGATPSGSASAASTAYGVRCVDCAGTTFSAGSVRGTGATTSGFGFHGTGDLSGVTAMTTAFGGGGTSTNGSSSVGIRLDTCSGAPTFTTTNSDGGFDLASSPLTGTSRTGISSTGARCAPVIDGGRHIGCERGNTCTGIECNTGSACDVRNATLVQGTVGAADTAAYGLRCTGGACASITTSTIQSGNLRGGATIGTALDLDGASPRVDDCLIVGPGGSTTAATTGRFDALYLQGTSSTVSNCVIREGSGAGTAAFNGTLTVIRFDQSAGIVAMEPTIVNDTVEYSGCATCGARIGLVVNGAIGGVSGALGIVRNTILRNIGTGGTTNPVVERGTNADLAFFQNNALRDLTAATSALYLDEGTTALGTASQINTMMMGGTSGGNLVADCNLTAAFRLPMSSMCRNAGTSLSCPRADFDAQVRPNEMACDIGADEFYP